jgi:trk system potassium uptake protein TrkH
VGYYYGETDGMVACLWSSLVSALIGTALWLPNRHSTVTAEGRPDYFRREGLAVVGLVWIICGAVGALPYLLAGTFDGFVDAFFETTSGFTTTGSTVLSPEGIDSLPRCICFWRSFTHWLGGFGIVMVFVVLFPTGGRSLFRSEIPGIAREAGQQRVRDSAMGLLRIYVGLSVVELLLLWTTGMGWFDATVHTFGTIATGGFSSHSESVAFFLSWKVELIIGFFMFAAGINFAIYDVFLRAGPRPAWRRLIGSSEVRLYVGIIVGATLFLGGLLWFWGGSNGDPTSTLPDYRNLGRAIRDSAFQVVCLNTSTGYGTADFDQWPQLGRMTLMFLAVIGACAGSTGGGLKVIRLVIVSKAAITGVRRFIRPRAIHAVRVDGQTVDDASVSSITSYFALWILVFLGGTLILTAFDLDLVSASTAVLATLNNIGPGLAKVGPSMNFAELPELAKLLLSLFMIFGRLEFYAVVALFVPSFWRS